MVELTISAAAQQELINVGTFEWLWNETTRKYDLKTREPVQFGEVKDDWEDRRIEVSQRAILNSTAVLASRPLSVGNSKIERTHRTWHGGVLEKYAYMLDHYSTAVCHATEKVFSSPC